jgi:DNA-binding MarR family transcriptional regulator
MDAITINSAENLVKIQSTLHKHEISLSVLIMVALVEETEMNLTDVAQIINVSASSMTTVKDAAEKLGFIQEYSIEDRRKKLYGITDKGKELLASCRQ